MTHRTNPLLIRASTDRALLESSSNLLEGQKTILEKASALIRPAGERALERKLSDAVLAEAERVQEVALRKHSEEASLQIAVMTQIAVDTLRNQHRQTIHELSQIAEDELAHSLNQTFRLKKQLTEKIFDTVGDDNLKNLAQLLLAELTMASAKQLIDRNSRLSD